MRTYGFGITAAISALCIVALGCSGEPARESRASDEDGSAAAGGPLPAGGNGTPRDGEPGEPQSPNSDDNPTEQGDGSNRDDLSNDDRVSIDDVDLIQYDDGGCAYECAWGEEDCRWGLEGVPVPGDCGGNQSCCYVGESARIPCRGTCVMEWESCPTGTSAGSGNCSDTQQVCCGSGSASGDGDADGDSDADVDGDVDGDGDSDAPVSECRYRVDEDGNIIACGERFPVRCGNWFGLEGQHEPPDAENNPDGAPMELYVGNMWWGDTGRDIQQTMDEIKALGFNMIRLPIAPQTLDPTDPQGTGSVQSGGVLKNHPSVIQENARQALEDFIKQADRNDLKVLVDIHSCSNYVGWRAGRLDAAPPYADADRVGYDFKREDYTCASGKDAYNDEKWLEDIKEIAGFPTALGVDNIIGIDIFNEPWDYTWEEWKDLAEKAFLAIDSVNSDLLIFVEGIGSKTSAGIEVPHGAEETNPNWGENFFEMGDNPLDIPKDRLVLSPHTYGPSVFVQKQFMEGECSEMEGDAAGEADCPIRIDPVRLEPGWEEHFGYLRDQGYAMVMGEFGGNINWPKDTREAEQEMWGHITDTPDLDWQNAFVDYLIEQNIQGCYWSINPESGDTGGLYTTPYKPDVNEAAWGEWGGFDPIKEELLLRYWDGLENR